MASSTASEPKIVKSEAKKRLLVTEGELRTRSSIVLKSCAAWSRSMLVTAACTAGTSVSGSTVVRIAITLRVCSHSSSRAYCQTCCRNGM